jgi:OOP family OmpA-OmpF porin
MKRTLTLALFASMAIAANAQDPTIIVIDDPDFFIETQQYNRWSLDIQGGFNHATAPLSATYNTATLGLWHAGIGARYMLNPKFGLRLGLNYDQIQGTDGSPSFSTNYYRSSLEGVINLGNVLSFEQWTSCFGLLFHAGAGYSAMQRPGYTNATDNMMNVVGGITPQFRLGDRMNLYFDATIVSNANMDYTYDFTRSYSSRGLTGYLYQYSVGLQFNLGPHDTHADWMPSADRVSDLEDRISELEEGQRDNDNDGVVNHIDQEPNTPYGTLVDTKGRSIVWYEVYQEIDNPEELSAGYLTYVNSYEVLFATEATDIDPMYQRTLNNIAMAMINNPSYKLSLTGHADDRGASDFNLDLSKRRAEAVKNYLVGKGVAEGRISTSGVGETQPKSTEKSAESRAENRRVQFSIK